MRTIRSLVLVMMCFLLISCENWQQTNVEQVSARVVDKYSRRPGKVPRRYYVVIEYEGKQTRVRDSSAYRTTNIGDPYPACLITYVLPEKDKTRIELEPC